MTPPLEIKGGVFLPDVLFIGLLTSYPLSFGEGIKGRGAFFNNLFYGIQSVFLSYQ
jgi:hypothetical protein